MNKISTSRMVSRDKHTSRLLLFITTIIAVITFNGYSNRAFAADVSFCWHPNSVYENVLGYRLYYGSSSRFQSNGSLKSNFSYDYYIDFNFAQKCSIATNICTPLTSKDYSCSDLGSSSPLCTVHNLSGTNYFTLTAYNMFGMSPYSQEIAISSSTVSPTVSFNILTYIPVLLTEIQAMKEIN